MACTNYFDIAIAICLKFSTSTKCKNEQYHHRIDAWEITNFN